MLEFRFKGYLPEKSNQPIVVMVMIKYSILLGISKAKFQQTCSNSNNTVSHVSF